MSNSDKCPKCGKYTLERYPNDDSPAQCLNRSCCYKERRGKRELPQLITENGICYLVSSRTYIIHEGKCYEVPQDKIKQMPKYRYRKGNSYFEYLEIESLLEEK